VNARKGGAKEALICEGGAGSTPAPPLPFLNNLKARTAGKLQAFFFRG